MAYIKQQNGTILQVTDSPVGLTPGPDSGTFNMFDCTGGPTLKGPPHMVKKPFSLLLLIVMDYNNFMSIIIENKIWVIKQVSIISQHNHYEYAELLHMHNYYVNFGSIFNQNVFLQNFLVSISYDLWKWPVWPTGHTERSAHRLWARVPTIELNRKSTFVNRPWLSL